jgi:hypothetical protein
MVNFQLKNTNLGKFWTASEWTRLVYCRYGRLQYITSIWYILWPFSNLDAIWYIFPRFGTLCQEKSGNPVPTYIVIYFIAMDAN